MPKSNCTRSIYRINQEVLNKCNDSDLRMLCELIHNFIKMTPDQEAYSYKHSFF